jgi:hypothetical protein
MPAEIEAVAVELDRLRDAAHGAVGFEDRRVTVALGEGPSRAQSGRTGTEHSKAEPPSWRSIAGHRRSSLAEPLSGPAKRSRDLQDRSTMIWRWR